MAGLAARLARTSLVTRGPARRRSPEPAQRPGGRRVSARLDARRELEIALRRGWSLLQAVPRAQPIFVPPWNDVHPRAGGGARRLRLRRLVGERRVRSAREGPAAGWTRTWT